MFKSIKSYFTTRLVKDLFYDSIGGLQVSLYVDCYNNMYMKSSRWSVFKVRYKS